MQVHRVKIFFHDEAPQIGCGARRVNVQIGRKWVHVRDDHGHGRKFTRNQYATLKPQQIEERA